MPPLMTSFLQEAGDIFFLFFPHKNIGLWRFLIELKTKTTTKPTKPIGFFLIIIYSSRKNESPLHDITPGITYCIDYPYW